MGKFNDLTGKRFGRLVVIKRAPNQYKSNGKPRAVWECECDCGNHKNILGELLTRGITISCGCYQKERAREANSTHGKTDSRLYGVWCAMKARCSNENIPTYPLYGGKGVKVCDEWVNSFENFMDWAISHGYDEQAPRGQCTVDRIDGNGDYCPENCRIITQLEQANNIRTNRYLEYNGERHTLAEWGRIFNIHPGKISNRIDKLGWTTERALTTP